MIFFFWLTVFLILGAVLNASWLVMMSGAALVIFTAAWFWRFWSLSRVIYRRRWHYRRGFPGETTPVRLEVENNKWLPLSWLRISDLWPLAAPPREKGALTPSHIQGTGQVVTLLPLSGFERVTRTYQLEFLRRGVYQVGPATLESGDYFGFFEHSLESPDTEQLTVFPELLPMEALKLNTDNPFGRQQARRRLFEDPNSPMGVRAYLPDDDFRRIHWPATARTGELQVKVYQPVSSQVIALYLNVTTSVQPWIGTNLDLLEQLIKVSATLAYHWFQKGYSVGLLSNGSLAHADQPFRILPGRSSNQLSVLLQALASVTPYYGGSIESCLMASMHEIPYGASLVIVTGLVTSQLQETLLRLKRYRQQIILYTLEAETTAEVPGIKMIHIPFQPEGAERK